MSTSSRIWNWSSSCLPGAALEVHTGRRGACGLITKGGQFMRLQDRTAIVTGAASGIGRAIARHFAGEGARVIIADVRAGNRASILVTADNGYVYCIE